MGCWTNTDDYLLISSVLHLSDLERVHKKVKFSMDFSLENIQDRWKCILYHAPISKFDRPFRKSNRLLSSFFENDLQENSTIVDVRNRTFENSFERRRRKIAQFDSF